jgi:anti-anti-sigma factor
MCVAAEPQTIDALRQENERLQQRVAALEQAQQQNETILEAADMLIVVLDPEGRIVRFNQACVATTGFPADEVIGQQIWDILIPPEQVDAVKGVFQALAFDQMPNRYENHWLTREGKRRLLAWSNTLLRDAQGQVSAIIGTAQDITEQRQQATQLAQHRETLRGFLDNLPAVIYAVDREGRLMLANQHWSTAVGMPMEQALGKTMSELFDSAESAAWETYNRQIQDAGVVDQREETVPQADGLHTYQSIRFPIRDEAGQVYGMGGISSEITERKQQEAELRMFKLLIENAPVMISVAGTDLRYRYYNPAFREHMGIAPDAAPQDFMIPDMSPPEMAEPLRQLIPQIIEQGGWKGRSIFRRQDGSTFPGDLAVFVTRDTQGNPEQFIAIANDASEQVAAEEERATLQQQLIDAQRDALRELSTPLIPISDDVVIMPLIGSIDSGRAQMIMETLLEGVARYQAQLVILDITGVQIVDTQVAQAFIQAAQAVRLLGAQVMLTGIQPQIAQTLVHLGVDLGGLRTAGSLQAGIAAALQR